MVAPRTQHAGKTAAEKHRERLERVRAKERANKASCTMRRLRGKQLPGAEWQDLAEGVRNVLSVWVLWLE